MKHIFTLLTAATISVSCLTPTTVYAEESVSNPLEMAQRFSGDKLWSMLFSTTVDPHWFQSGEKFWYSYKTADGTKWYIV
ncbi:MAG: hypothetical protein K2I16_10320, partial [Muribaculaceae bacterium]|nr:hypothetical protein [Muribaculaceae bacterium]